jgi:solute:Na+ symporter, SSS family
MLSSDRDARRMLLIPFLGALLGPVIWFIPSMSAAITHTDLTSLYPNLPYPNEAAFLATSQAVLPQGMMGLLICGIFAATLTTMDASLNQSAGIFVRNFYLPVMNRTASEKRLLVMSKIATGVMGLLTLGVALYVAWLRKTGQAGGLFDLITQTGISIMFPMAVPLFLGFFYKRTPGWSTWSTALIGLAVSWLVKFRIKPEVLDGIPFLQGPHKPEEVTSFYIFATVFSVTAVCTLWFFFTSLFYNRTSQEFRNEVDAFFERLRTPSGGIAGEKIVENRPLLRTIGRLSMLYGAFILLFSLIPNDLRGRLCFVAGGGSILAIGFWLSHIYRPLSEVKSPSET